MFTQVKTVETNADDQVKLAAFALDLNSKEVGIAEYLEMTSQQKVDLIIAHLKIIIQQAQKTHPDDPWLVVLREHGITNTISKNEKPRLSTRFYPLTIAEKNDLNNRIKPLMAEYKNLNFIAGSVSLTPRLDDIEKKLEVKQAGKLSKKEMALEKLAKIKTYYAEHKKILNCKKSHLEVELKKISAVENEIKASDSDKKLDELLSDIAVMSNTSYIFLQAEDKSVETKAAETKEIKTVVTVIKHRKSTPFDESGRRPHLLFRPASKASTNNTFEILHPKTGQKIKARLYICNENNMIEKASDEHLEIVISNNVYISYADLLNRRNLLHVDSKCRPRLIKTGREKIKVDLFVANLLDKDPKVSGPLKPCYPFEAVVLKELDKFINLYQAAEVKSESENPVGEAFQIYNNKCKSEALALAIFKLEVRPLTDLRSKILKSSYVRGIALEFEVMDALNDFAKNENNIYLHIAVKQILQKVEEFKKISGGQRINSNVPAPVEEMKLTRA